MDIAEIGEAIYPQTQHVAIKKWSMNFDEITPNFSYNFQLKYL